MFDSQNLPAKVDPAAVEDQIQKVFYYDLHQAARGTGEWMELPSGNRLDMSTCCVIILKNGWIEHGYNSCVSREVFNPAIGRRQAYNDAMYKLMARFGFMLIDAKSKAA